MLFPRGYPELGALIDTNFIARISLLTGTLPAQYGLRTAGVLDIISRSYATPNGEVSLYGGSPRVVDQQIALGDSVAELHDFEIEAVLADALVAVLAEDQRLAVFELDDMFLTIFFFRHAEPCAVIEDVAILEDLDVGRAFVGGGFFQGVLQVLLEDVDRARDEGGRLGQEKEFAATRRKTLAFAKDTNQWVVAERAAKACSILPAADKADLEAAPALGRAAVQLQRNGWTLLALGMAEYRSTNDAAAQEALLAAANANPSNPQVTGIAAFYRAMSLFRQGKRDEARQLALAAAAKMKPLPKDEQNPLANNPDPDDLILWLAYKEAKAMLKFEATQKERMRD